MKKLPNWIRWILLLPLSILAFATIRILNSITFSLYISSDSIFAEIFNIFVEGTIAVAGMLGTAYCMAPKNKLAVVIGLSIVLGILAVAGSTFSLTHDEVSTPLWKVLASAILTIGTCIYTCSIVAKEENKDAIK